jgi:hypothetical protein
MQEKDDNASYSIVLDFQPLTPTQAKELFNVLTATLVGQGFSLSESTINVPEDFTIVHYLKSGTSIESSLSMERLS